VDTAEARAVLGVTEGEEWRAVRAAFRRLVRAHHPDVAGPSTSASAGVTRVIEAYATLDADRRAPASAGSATGRPRPPPPPTAADGDTVTVHAPRHEVFFRVLEAAHELGEVTYVDPNLGILETVVEFEGWPTCSLLVTLQGRATGATEAWCTLEALSGEPAPPVAAVALLLRERIRRPG